MSNVPCFLWPRSRCSGMLPLLSSCTKKLAAQANPVFALQDSIFLALRIAGSWAVLNSVIIGPLQSLLEANRLGRSNLMALTRNIHNLNKSSPNPRHVHFDSIFQFCLKSISASRSIASCSRAWVCRDVCQF